MKRRSEKQMGRLGALYAKLVDRIASLDEVDQKIIKEANQMLDSKDLSTKDASKIIQNLEQLESKAGNGGRTVHQKQQTQSQGVKINSLQNRQRHCPDEIQEQISPLMARFKDKSLSSLSYDEANELIKLLDACQSKTPDDS